MQRAIVPYVPPVGCSTRASHARNFANFVQAGGRVHPIPLGAAPGVYGDVETAPLLGRDSDTSEALKIVRASSRQARITQFAVVVALLLAMAVFGALGIVVWRVNSNLRSVEDAVRPHAANFINSTLDMMNDIGGSMHNLHDISGYTNELAAVAGGSAGSASVAMNSTAVITQQLAAFMKHPTIQLSLGGG